MKIGIEASRLIEHGRTGTQNYLYNLVRKLSEMDKDNDYTLYFRYEPSQKFLTDLFLGNPRFKYKTLRSCISWTQVSLAKECFKNTPNILLCPWQTIPIIHRNTMNIISVIHGLEYAWGRGIPTWLTCILSDYIIVVSEFTRQSILNRFHITPDKIKVMHEGVDLSVISRPNNNKIQEILNKYEIDTKYLFFLGTINARKNIKMIISAFKLAIEGGGLEDCKLILGGGFAPGFEKLKDLSDNDGIRFLGRVPDKDLSSLLSGAEALIFASKSEGFGLPILEAFATGTAVITSDNSGMKEVAGDSACLVDPFSVNSIANGIRKVLLEKNYKDRLVLKASERVKRFTWDTSAVELIELFGKIKDG